MSNYNGNPYYEKKSKLESLLWTTFMLGCIVAGGYACKNIRDSNKQLYNSQDLTYSIKTNTSGGKE